MTRSVKINPENILGLIKHAESSSETKRSLERRHRREKDSIRHYIYDEIEEALMGTTVNELITASGGSEA